MKKLNLFIVTMLLSSASFGQGYADCKLTLKELKKADAILKATGKRGLYLHSSIYNDDDMEAYEVTTSMVFNVESCNPSIKLSMPGSVPKKYIMNLSQEYSLDGFKYCSYSNTFINKANETPSFTGLTCKKSTTGPF